MKAQKKYVTREMILRDIEKSLDERDQIRKEAEFQDHLAKSYAEFNTASGAEKSAQVKEWATKLWEKAERIEATRLVKLKRTLAAFDTQPMFGDSQVVLQQK